MSAESVTLAAMSETDEPQDNTTVPEYRTGWIDVLVSSRLDIDEVQAVVRKQVHAELSKTNEWPVRITARTGVRHSEGVMSWKAKFETGPFGAEIS